MKKVNKRKLKVTESLSPDSKKINYNVSFPKTTGKQTKLKVTGGMLSNPTIYNFFDTKGSKLSNNKSPLSIDSSFHQHIVSSSSLSFSSYESSTQALPATISTTSFHLWAHQLQLPQNKIQHCLKQTFSGLLKFFFFYKTY